MADDPPRILLVEADVLVRHPLAEYLRECGYNVAEALDDAEARALLSQDNLPIDIILAQGDQNFKLASWVKHSHPHIETILAGTVARVTEKAGTLCEEGPAPSTPYDHKFVLDRIRRLTAARQRTQNSAL